MGLVLVGTHGKYTAERTGTLARAKPDFMFINCNPLQPLPEELAPASYARTLLHLRWALQSTEVLGSLALRSTEACQITLHSMKSTMLACAAQLNMPKEHRMAQGHHRDSALLYSRNDTYASLRIQRAVCTSIASGFRPEHSMAQGAQAPLPEPPFSASAQHPPEKLHSMDLRSGPWALFISRHEIMAETPQNTSPTEPEQPPSTTNADNAVESDSEAEAVRLWAMHNSPSEHESDGEETQSKTL